MGGRVVGWWGGGGGGSESGPGCLWDAGLVVRSLVVGLGEKGGGGVRGYKNTNPQRMM